MRLDGLPLAIELAAARIKLLPPHALLARLSNRFEVLTSGMRTLPSRQQTLRNALKWSYDLLDASEQRLFRRLAVFVDGWTLEAVETVCYYDREQERDAALDEVASLLDKSLLLETSREDEEPRLQMLMTVREYGLECLRESGEAEVTQQAHTLYYLALAEKAEQQQPGGEQALWLERLQQELDNLRAALNWLSEQPDGELNLRLSASLYWFWIVRGYFNEGQFWTEKALVASERDIKLLSAASLPPPVETKRHAATYPDELTAREVEVLRLLAQGYSDAQIAEHLIISVRTVNTHVGSIYRKIQVTARAAATRYALEHGLI